MATEYYAHSGNEAGSGPEPLRDHLTRVAERARAYCAPFGMEDEAYLAGMLHDLGKYGDRFQRRLEGTHRHEKRCELCSPRSPHATIIKHTTFQSAWRAGLHRRLPRKREPILARLDIAWEIEHSKKRIVFVVCLII